MSFIVEEKQFCKEKTVNNGNKFLTGNGYMGYRGTLEEYTKDELVACNLLGLYDKQGDLWREPVNAPNGLYTTVFFNGKQLSVLNEEPSGHTQTIDIQNAVHSRKTVFQVPGGEVTVKAERFVSLDQFHLIALKYSVMSTLPGGLTVKTGIDGKVWDINGPHFETIEPAKDQDIIFVQAVTGEQKAKVAVAEAVQNDFEALETTRIEGESIYRSFEIKAEAGREYTITKFVSVYTSNDGVPCVSGAAKALAVEASSSGFENALHLHKQKWAKNWEASDVVIEGDDEAQLALRYSLYQLLIIAPRHSDRVSIPARGLSGQTYKGAIFWDTEMFMLPFFLHTNPEIARNLIRYRVHTLDGARRKAAYYGYRGAFYAWESQETGDDACSHFNVTDVFTGRPMRTYFRDKQIHISADVAHAVFKTYEFTGDDSVLLLGGAEVILECARFFYSYSYFKEDKGRYEILDVTGPDEYHERVNNNAYTNKMIKNTFDAAVKACEILRAKYPAEYDTLIEKLNYKQELENIERIKARLYIPAPDDDTGIIEQFDGYHRLEDCSVAKVKSRIIDEKEYWGGANGIAANTKVLKQADVVLMLYLFRNEYTKEIKAKNWEYYEQRTEHGSSLSPCIYALLACECDNEEWAYPYFMKTASVDLSGQSKQFAGTIYIGGTHPAANGGAWMAAVLGFAGLNVDKGEIKLNPKLPKKWNRLKFNIVVKGEKYTIDINKEEAKICRA